MASFSFSFNFDEFAANGGTQEDLDAFAAQIASRTWFDLAIPDPDFFEHVIDPRDQLSARPVEGRLAIATVFERLQLHVFDFQVMESGEVRGYEVLSDLRIAEALVLGPNLGQLLYENQHLIPEEFRNRKLFFWGKIYRDPEDDRYVRCLYWNGSAWQWSDCYVDGPGWGGGHCAVVLRQV